ncbi:MAG: DUF2087 domain-containing protein [Cellulosilyticaceae bacterium]
MEENINELFWNATVEEIKRGYIEEDVYYQCIICGEKFVKGEVFPFEARFFDARKMITLHIQEQHHSMLRYMMQMNRSFLGITDVQRDFLQYLIESADDKEVAAKMGIHPSTVRNHKYRLREKEKQAKLFLAMMELVEADQDKSMQQVEDTVLHSTSKTATMVDDRYNTTEAEKEKIIRSYMDETGSLKSYPAKEKRKIVVLEAISKNFKKGRSYNEHEVNLMLTRIYSDHVLLRRALIEYGFMERDQTGTKYWIKE